MKACARRAGLDPAEFGGHSLRAGFVTSAAEKGASAGRIMGHTGHRSHARVRVYTRRADAFSDHPGEGCCEAVQGSTWISRFGLRH